jgi:hypothetical protein
MKYTIEGLGQQALIDLGLDCVDAVILRWIIDFRDTCKMREKRLNGREMFWLNYGYLLESLPIIGITNKEVLARRMTKICESGLMNKHVDKGAEGTFTYFNFNADKLGALFHPPTESTPALPLGRPPVLPEGRPIDSSIKEDSSIRRAFHCVDENPAPEPEPNPTTHVVKRVSREMMRGIMKCITDAGGIYQFPRLGKDLKPLAGREDVDAIVAAFRRYLAGLAEDADRRGHGRLQLLSVPRFVITIGDYLRSEPVVTAGKGVEVF